MLDPIGPCSQTCLQISSVNSIPLKRWNGTEFACCAPILVCESQLKLAINVKGFVLWGISDAPYWLPLGSSPGSLSVYLIIVLLRGIAMSDCFEANPPLGFQGLTQSLS